MGGSSAETLRAAVESHYDELVAFVRRKVNCPVLAADIVQETCTRLVSRRAAASIANPRAFLYRIAGNLVIDHLRQEQRRARYVRPALPTDDIAEVADTAPSAESALEAKRRLTRLVRAVDELPPRCREVFVLRKFEGLEQAEIAATLGISRNMVEKHLRKALLHCAARLDEHD